MRLSPPTPFCLSRTPELLLVFVPFFCPFFVLCLATRFGISVNLSKASFFLANAYSATAGSFIALPP
jgi:hypothetical protein